MRRGFLAAMLAVAAALAGCGDDSAPVRAEGTDAACELVAPERLVPEVVRTLEHASDAFTQGLVLHDGRLFESTGRYGSSSIRELDPDTGEVLVAEPIDADVFGEGLAVGAEGRLVQLTWKEGVAYERDPDSLEEVGRFRYDGEGWGLATLDDGTLVMSDGSDVLVRRDPATFEPLASVTIRRTDGPADQLNELEWDGESLWANRYQSDEVLRIDPDCAAVTGVLDVTELTEDAGAAVAPGDPELGVSNGIAHLAGTDRYLLTGKNWPRLYEVTVEPAS